MITFYCDKIVLNLQLWIKKYIIYNNISLSYKILFFEIFGSKNI